MSFTLRILFIFIAISTEGILLFFSISLNPVKDILIFLAQSSCVILFMILNSFKLLFNFVVPSKIQLINYVFILYYIVNM